MFSLLVYGRTCCADSQFLAAAVIVRWVSFHSQRDLCAAVWGLEGEKAFIAVHELMMSAKTLIRRDLLLRVRRYSMAVSSPPSQSALSYEVVK